MKKIMKKALSLALALVMMLSLAPMTADAALIADDYHDGLDLTTAYGLDAAQETITVGAGAGLYYCYQLGNMMNPSVATETVKLKVTGADGTLVMAYAPNMGGELELNSRTAITDGSATIEITSGRNINMGMGGLYYFCVYNSSETSQDYSLTFTPVTAGGSGDEDEGDTDPEGSMNNPAELPTAGYPPVTAETNGSYYWYTWTASEVSRLTIQMIPSTGWNLSIKVGNETDGFVTKEYDTNNDDNDGVPTDADRTFEIDVEEDDVVTIAVGDDGTISEVSFYASVSAVGTQDLPAPLKIGTNVAPEMDYYYTWTAPKDGVLTFTPGEGTQYGVADDAYGFDEYITEVSTLEVEAGDVIYINPWTDSPSVTVTLDVAYEAYLTVDGNMHSNDQKTYSDSATTLAIGANNVPVCVAADYTLYYFTAKEDGKYTFAVNGEAEVYNCGSMNYLIAGTDGSNTVTVELKKDAETVIGVSGVESDECTITVTKAAASQEVSKYYDNTVSPVSFTYEGDAEKLFYVYVKDGKADTAVKGSDGYYHYGSENGPILYVNLEKVPGIDYYNLSETALKGGLKVKLEDGTVINYSAAVNEYVSFMDSKTKLYPLTDDLKEVLVAYGNAQGWYDYDGTLNYLFTDANGDRVKVNEETAWLFACCYAGAVNTEKTQVKWVEGSKEDLVITFAAEYRDFADEVKINGVKLDPKYYTVTEGSTIVTISADYLATLPKGDYTVAASFFDLNGDVYDLTATFTIAAPTVAPKTADSSNYALWLAVLGLGVVAIAGSVVMKKREF